MPFRLSRGPCSHSRRLQWSITPRGSYPIPRCCRGATAAASLRSADVARQRRRASKAKAANKQWLSQATAFRRSLWEKKAKPRHLTACTSGLWNAPFLYLTASPSRPPQTHRHCRPSRSWCGRTTWRTAAGGLSRFPGPGLCREKCLSYEKPLFLYLISTNPWPFRKWYFLKNGKMHLVRHFNVLPTFSFQ